MSLSAALEEIRVFWAELISRPDYDIYILPRDRVMHREILLALVDHGASKELIDSYLYSVVSQLQILWWYYGDEQEWLLHHLAEMAHSTTSTEEEDEILCSYVESIVDVTGSQSYDGLDCSVQSLLYYFCYVRGLGVEATSRSMPFLEDSFWNSIGTDQDLKAWTLREVLPTLKEGKAVPADLGFCLPQSREAITDLVIQRSAAIRYGKPGPPPPAS